MRASNRPLWLLLFLLDAPLALLGAVHLWPNYVRWLLARWRVSLVVLPTKIPWRDLRTTSSDERR